MEGGDCESIGRQPTLLNHEGDGTFVQLRIHFHLKDRAPIMVCLDLGAPAGKPQLA